MFISVVLPASRDDGCDQGDLSMTAAEGNHNHQWDVFSAALHIM